MCETNTPTTLTTPTYALNDSISLSPFSTGTKNLENLFETQYGHLFSPTDGSSLMKDSFMHLLSEDNQLSPFMNIPSPNILRNTKPIPMVNPIVQIPEQTPPELKLPPYLEKKKFIRKRKQNSVPSVPISIPQQPIPQIPIQHERAWKTIYIDPKIGNIGIRVHSKTRCDQPSDFVEEKLYSSLKYELRQYITGDFCSTLPFLLARVRVVDSATGNPIVKDKKTVLKGIIECALTKQPGGKATEIQGVLKVQFTDCSYHHKKTLFCLEISYYEPNELNHAILIERSAPFKVFARKPNQNKKRKKSLEPFEDFCSRLEDLQKCFKKLKSEDKQTALSLVQDKLITLDPNFLSQKSGDQQVNSFFA